MLSRRVIGAPVVCFLLAFAPQVFSQSTSTSSVSSTSQASPSSGLPTSPPPTGPTSSSSTSGSSGSGSTVSSSSSAADPSAPPDVLLHVPQLSVGRIELDVDDLKADINLNANVASLVSINAGVAVSIEKVNITIADVEAELDLIVRLGHLVDIVNRVFESLDLNPLLINTLNNVTSILEPIVGAVDGLLGSITQGGTTLNFLVDNLGNIVQEVSGPDGPVSTIVGNYLTNMTDTGIVKELGSGLTQKTFQYSPLNALVDIVFNSAGQVVQALVSKSGGSGGSSSTTATTSGTATLPIGTSSGTAAARR